MSKKCELPGCSNNARRRFCCNKHKDRFHNMTNPRGIYSHIANREFDPNNDLDGLDVYAEGDVNYATIEDFPA